MQEKYWEEGDKKREVVVKEEIGKEEREGKASKGGCMCKEELRVVCLKLKA